jgi:hypothetical protein
VTVTDGNACTTTSTATITQPTAITASATNTSVSCNSGSNGTITVTASGGTAPYTYSSNGTTFQASNSFTGLTAGTYTLTVKDANNCTQTTTTTITQNDPLTSCTYTSSQDSFSIGNATISGCGCCRVEIISVS